MKNEMDIFSNSTAILLLVVMFILVIVIGLLGNVLYGLAQVKYRREKKENDNAKTGLLGIILLLAAGTLNAQDAAATAPAAATGIAGMSYTSFFFMLFVLTLELIIVLAMLLQIRLMLRVEKAADAADTAPVKKESAIRQWWSKANAFKPVEKEADIMLDHNYDGIRELDNRLPPWWLYGFYATIIFSVIYLWRAEVTHAAPNGVEEYQASVEKAKKEVAAYLAAKGESVDENTVEMLAGAADLAAGKANFVTSCAACHLATGAGSVGPNLTDEYWLHGGDIKSVFKTIRYGINAMPAWQNTYSNKQIAQLASYVETLKGTNPPNAKAPEGQLYKPAAQTEKPAEQPEK